MPTWSNTGGRQIIEADYATLAALPSCTYANGSSGRGAKLTATANGALAAIDGIVPAVGDIILVNQQAAALQNMIGIVDDPGSAGTPFVIRRSPDADVARTIAGSEVKVNGGTLLAGTSWYLASLASAITVGATGLNWKPRAVMFGQVFGCVQNLGLATNPRYLVPSPLTTANTASLAVAQVPNPYPGVVCGMWCIHGVALATDSQTYTANVEGADTNMQAVIAASGLAANDTAIAHWFKTVAGDKFAIKAIQSGSQAASNLSIRVTLAIIPTG